MRKELDDGEVYEDTCWEDWHNWDLNSRMNVLRIRIVYARYSKHMQEGTGFGMKICSSQRSLGRKIF